jgi:uncharacterized membrane protein
VTSSLLADKLRQAQSSQPSRSPWLRVTMGVLATIGLLDTGSITLKRWGMIGSLTCPGGSNGCDQVLGSAWGTLFGQPLSLYGTLAYGLVLVLTLGPLLFKGNSRRTLGGLSQQALLLLCTGMAGFSMVLVGLMLFTIKAVCVFCVLSAVLSTVLFALSLLLNRQEERGSLIFRVVLTGLLVFLVGLGWASLADQPAVSGGPGMAPPVQAESTPAKVALAKHLTQVGARLYTAYWCPHCRDQKELFGKQAAAELQVIECAPDGRNNQAELCKQKGSRVTPPGRSKARSIPV